MRFPRIARRGHAVVSGRGLDRGAAVVTGPASGRARLVDPGSIHLAPSPEVLGAVVANGVAVCLWDPVRLLAGACHYRYPAAPDPGRATSLYGDAAILGLLRIMKEAGCVRERLQAHVVGGAVAPPELGIPAAAAELGMRNVEAARRALERRRIGPASEDVGGTSGRKVAFDAASGHLAVLKVQSLRAGDWAVPA